MHEAQLHNANSFITLTYDDKHLPLALPEWEPTVPYTPPFQSGVAQTTASDTHAKAHAQDATLRKRDAQLFMKRLRKEVSKRGASSKVKFYLVGEYGEKGGRPHYHAAIFGEDFSDDRYPWRRSPSGHQLYRSSTLEKLWPYGAAEIGELTFESAAYVARYIMKKITGKLADEHYKRVHPTTGQIYYLLPEFSLMSRGGREGHGIGKGWLDQYRGDVYPHDYVVVGNKKLKPPRYYDKLLERVDRELSILLKLEREFTARAQAADNTPSRLRAKEAVAISKLNMNKRKL